LARLITEQLTRSKADSVVVIGLGRFGGSVARSLIRLGHDVMGIDQNEVTVQEWADVLTHTAQCDSTKASVMRQLGVADFDHVVVGIGSDLSASLMTVMALAELGIKDIWVKAMSAEHGRIAQRIGAHHVVYPEAVMGERVAHLITGRMMDFIEFDDGFAIAKILAPLSTHHRALAESGVEEAFGVAVVGLKRADEDYRQARPDTRVLPGDVLIVSGPPRKIEAFAGRG
jgi:trk system potassium uptake protein TrkA